MRTGNEIAYYISMIYRSCNSGKSALPASSVTYPLPPLLGSFLDYWATRLIDGLPPVRNGDFSPAALRPWLGHLAVIERDGDSGFRFRLAGTNLHARFQAELTGRQLRDVEPDVVGDLEDRVQRAMSLKTSVITGVISADVNTRVQVRSEAPANGRFTPKAAIRLRSAQGLLCAKSSHSANVQIAPMVDRKWLATGE
jgi:hypothetical protein